MAKKLKPNDEMHDLRINFRLEDRERLLLAAHIHTEGFAVLRKVMENEIRLLNLKLMNTDASDETQVLANHRLAKAAGMFYSGVMQCLEEQVQIAAYSASGIGTIDNPEIPPMIPEAQ